MRMRMVFPGIDVSQVAFPVDWINLADQAELELKNRGSE